MLKEAYASTRPEVLQPQIFMSPRLPQRAMLLRLQEKRRLIDEEIALRQRLRQLQAVMKLRLNPTNPTTNNSLRDEGVPGYKRRASKPRHTHFEKMQRQIKLIQQREQRRYYKKLFRQESRELRLKRKRL